MCLFLSHAVREAGSKCLLSVRIRRLTHCGDVRVQISPLKPASAVPTLSRPVLIKEMVISDEKRPMSQVMTYDRGYRPVKTCQHIKHLIRKHRRTFIILSPSNN